LIDVSSRRSPAVNLIITSSSIDRWLGVDSQVTHLVHLCELLGDHRRLGRWWLGGPREFEKGAPTKVGKQGSNVVELRRGSPEVGGIGRLGTGQHCTE
jgi:hypothetical protein